MKIFIIVTTITIIFTSLTEVYLKNKGLGDPVRYDQAFYMGIHQSLTKKRLEGSYVTINELV